MPAQFLVFQIFHKRMRMAIRWEMSPTRRKMFMTVDDSLSLARLKGWYETQLMRLPDDDGGDDEEPPPPPRITFALLA